MRQDKISEAASYHRILIDMLGGPKKVAERIGLSESNLWRWKRLGIPKSRRLEVVDMAQKMGVPVDFKALNSDLLSRISQ